MLTFADRVPTVDEQRAVATAVGWGEHFDWASIGASLVGSLHGVVALDGDEVVGVGRRVGDGVRYGYVQDVMVRPEASDEGLRMGVAPYTDDVDVDRLLEGLEAALR